MPSRSAIGTGPSRCFQRRCTILRHTAPASGLAGYADARTGQPFQLPPPPGTAGPASSRSSITRRSARPPEQAAIRARRPSGRRGGGADRGRRAEEGRPCPPRSAREQPGRGPCLDTPMRAHGRSSAVHALFPLHNERYPLAQHMLGELLAAWRAAQADVPANFEPLIARRAGPTEFREGHPCRQ